MDKLNSDIDPDEIPFQALWDYGDPAGTEAKFRDLLPGIQEGGDPAVRLQLLTQIARALGLQNKFDEAHAILDRVEKEMVGGGVVELRYLLERGRALNSARQPETAVPLFHKAVEIGEQIGIDFYTVDALHMLGIAAPAEERLDWHLKAIAFAEGSPQKMAQNWLGSLYNNTAWTLFAEERYEEALALFEKAVVFRERQGKESEIQVARWCVGKTLRVIGRVEEGLAVQRALAAAGVADGFVEEEIAESLVALGQAEAAKPYFRAAYETLSQISWVAEDKARLERLNALSQ